MDERGVRPEHIKALRDIELLDFTVKNDLRDNYPYGLFAVPMDDVVRIHASSGTTGRPIVAGYTGDDLANWTECVARLCVAGGATRSDIAQVSFGYGLFTGAFGLHQGLEKIGATIVPISSGNTERQVSLMRDFGSTILISTPSYAMYMAEVAEKMDVIGDIKLRIGLFGAEASTKAMRSELERRWGILATENYGLTEVVGPRRQRRVRAQVRHARQRGLLPLRDHRPGDRAARCRRASRARWSSPRSPSGAMPHPALPHPRHHPPLRRALRLRPHDDAHGAVQGAAPTIC